MYLRKYHPSDCAALAALFYETIHTVNARDYPQEQLDAWADGHVDLWTRGMNRFWRTIHMLPCRSATAQMISTAVHLTVPALFPAKLAATRPTLSSSALATWMIPAIWTGFMFIRIIREGVWPQRLSATGWKKSFVCPVDDFYRIVRCKKEKTIPLPPTLPSPQDLFLKKGIYGGESAAGRSKRYLYKKLYYEKAYRILCLKMYYLLSEVCQANAARQSFFIKCRYRPVRSDIFFSFYGFSGGFWRRLRPGVRRLPPRGRPPGRRQPSWNGILRLRRDKRTGLRQPVLLLGRGDGR